MESKCPLDKKERALLIVYGTMSIKCKTTDSRIFHLFDFGRPYGSVKGKRATIIQHDLDLNSQREFFWRDLWIMSLFHAR